MELQQSPLYLTYLTRLGWHVVPIGSASFVWRNIPLAPTLAKLQRPDTLPDPAVLFPALKRVGVKRIAIEPSATISQNDATAYAEALRKNGFSVNTSEFLPTKTIVVDITKPENILFASCSEAKRRAVRKAVKNGIFVVETDAINEVIRTKNKAAGFLGSITTHGIRQMYETFGTSAMTGLLAYERSDIGNPVGAVLLVFYGNTAFYWIAGATRRGKQLFAPTLLVWEAIRTAKARGAARFDFLGVWDERKPTQNTEWKGFTKFKEGFGGTEEYYPLMTMPHR